MPNSLPPTRPLLSICIPTYNRARYLECLLQDIAAVLPGLGFSYEILIGDNCSHDDTPEVVAKYASRLALIHIRHPQNLGAYENLNRLYRAARGRYTIYLADDDFLILDAVRDLLEVLEANQDIGVVFAPWLIHDRLEGRDLLQFYSLDADVKIAQGDHVNLFTLLINRHLFPEIYIARTEIRQSIYLPVSTSAFIFFTQAAAMVDRASVLFAQKPFYRSTSRYFENETRTQAGHEEVKIGWDRYRGGLEYILSRFANRLTPKDLAACRAGIDRFAAIRMSVGLRLRTSDNQDWVGNYYLAARLRSTGHEDLLPAPYDLYRVNAALEHLLSLKPFLPETTRFAYAKNDPPSMLAKAGGFNAAPFEVVDGDGWEPRRNTVFVTALNDPPPGPGQLLLREEDLLAQFP